MNHVVPTVAYVIESPEGGVFGFSADTMENDTLWPVLNSYPKIDLFIV